METVYFLGVDISKKKIDVALIVDGINMVELQAETMLPILETCLMI